MGLLAMWGCAGFDPLPLDQTDLLQRSASQTREGLAVTVAVPTVDEARRLFDSKLHKKGIQPVWIEIRNSSDEHAWFFAHSVDADYFPPLEVAWRSHRTWAGKTNRRIDEFFYDQAVPFFVPPGAEASGWVFVNLDRGFKYVPLTLLREGAPQAFEFYVAVPGFRADHTSVDFYGLYSPEEVTDLRREEEVREWAAGLPCCTTNAKGTRTGDPLNFILVGSDRAFRSGFLRSGWDETAEMTTGSAMRTAGAAIFGKTYRNAPISPLHVLGRPQDLGLQKARKSIHQRNHLRLWLAPVTYRGLPVWVGQISRDIGSRLTSKSSTFTTHKIDPDVDDSRTVLLLDLGEARVVAAFGFASGVGAATPDEPRRNLTGDPWFSDGLRLVLFLTETPTEPTNVRFLDWEDPLPTSR